MVAYPSARKETQSQRLASQLSTNLVEIQLIEIWN